MTFIRPRVSVIMATLNAERFIHEAISTVASQTCPDWELIVMDAGSTDGTIDIARGFQRANIRLVQQPDEGPAHAWDRGLDLARGDYVLYLCSSDGYLDDTWFAYCVDLMDRDSEVALVWATPAAVDEDGGNLTPLGLHPSMIERYQMRGWVRLWLTTGHGFPDFSICVRREVLRACTPRYQSGTSAPDYLYEFEYNFNRAGYLPFGVARCAAFARRHEGQLSTGGEYREKMRWLLIDYARRVRRYRSLLLSGVEVHVFRDGQGNPLDALSLQSESEADFYVVDETGKRLDVLKGTVLADGQAAFARELHP